MEDSKWCHLPIDILTEIAKRLGANQISNFQHLRAVCSSWHSSLSDPGYSHYLLHDVPSPFQPENVENFLFETSDSTEGLENARFCVTESIFLLLSPVDGTSKTPWIIQVEETRPSKWVLINPCAFGNYTSNPAELPNPINLLDYRVINISRSYELYLPYDEYFGIGSRNSYVEPVDTGLKVIVRPDGATFDDVHTAERIACLALQENSGRLALWKLDADEWTPVLNESLYLYDVICYQDDFYAVDVRGRLFKVHLDKLTLVEIVKEQLPLDIIPDNINLVLFDGCFFLVASTFIALSGPPDQRVFVLNMKDGVWESTDDFHDGVFLFRSNTMIAVSSKDLSLPKGNFIHYYGC